ncbi:MAG: HD family phosphohydrolase, partial [Chloroflexota bacterium]
QVQPTALALLSTIPPQVGLDQRTAIGEVLSAFLAPTEVPDLAATIARRHAVAAQVATVYTTLYPGQVIIRRGDVVTPTVLEELSALGLTRRSTDWHDIAATVLFVAVVLAILFWYLSAFQTEVMASIRLWLFMDVALVATVLAARLLTGGHVLLPFFLPIAAISTFAAVLIAPEACLALTLAMALLAGWVVANSFELTTYYFLTGAAGVLAIHHLRQIKQFVIAGLCTTLFAFGIALAFGLVQHTYDIAAVQEYVLAAAFNGFLSSTLALGGFALLSGFFGVTTVLQLYELSQPNQPLLRRLTSKAPGTYNHSLVVSNMVEQAAEAIGVNALAAKVAALYHDVGKTANPSCFVENQMGIGNVHDELRPEESARIIRGHVLQGLRLARQHHLPRTVVDGIAEHHGTMPLTYFLHRAEHTTPDEPIDLALYRYPGPRPQSKETALLMLADGCEAAVRAAHDHSREHIRATVQMIFQERVGDGQLDESPLTLRDLDTARSIFSSVLNGLYHPRIEYPETTDLHVQSHPASEIRTGSQF